MFTKQDGPALGNVHFIWKEEGKDDLLTNRQVTINHIVRSLPKLFSCLHKLKCKALTSLVMHDKISPAKFHAIYSELTGDVSTADNSNSKAVDECMKLIMSTADKSILRDLRVNNGHGGLFDAFWDVTKKKKKNFKQLLLTITNMLKLHQKEI